MATDKQPKPTRRAVLKRLGLASAMAYIAPALTPLGTARASTSDGSSGASRDVGSSPSGPAPRQSARQRARQAPPELVALVPAGVTRDAAVAAGYVVLAERTGVLGSDLLRLGLPSGRTPAQAILELAQLLPGTTADLNHLYAPDDFLCRDGLCDAHAFAGWSTWPSALVPKLGMIDTGVNVDHDALSGQKLTVLQAALAERDAAGRQHGTAVAALLIGRMDSRVPGLLPNAELIAVEAFHRGSSGEAADAFALSDALQQLLDADVQVINLSFSGPQNAILERVVAEALLRGVGLVAAAGNGGPGAPPAYPAAWPGVLAVTAVDSRLAPYRQAARGAHVAFAAPGVNLWTAASVSGGRLRSGTSYAAPFVTAALAIELLRQPGRPLTDAVSDLARCALDLGEAGRDDTFGNGVVSSPNQCLAQSAAAESENFRLSGE